MYLKGNRINLAKRMLLAIVGLFIVTVCMSHTQANTTALIDTGYQPGLISSLSADTVGRTVGWEFTPTCDILITQLGYFDSGPAGLNIHHEIGIWNESEQLVVSATVPSGLTGSWDDEYYRYVSVSSTPLAADQRFIIGATVPSPIVWPSGFEADEYPAKTPFIDPNAILFNSCISLVANRYAQGNTIDMFELNFPYGSMPEKNFTDPLSGQEITIKYYFFAPNFGFVLELDPSPEPTTLMFLMLGATTVLGCPGRRLTPRLWTEKARPVE